MLPSGPLSTPPHLWDLHTTGSQRFTRKGVDPRLKQNYPALPHRSGWRSSPKPVIHRLPPSNAGTGADEWAQSDATPLCCRASLSLSSAATWIKIQCDGRS